MEKKKEKIENYVSFVNNSQSLFEIFFFCPKIQL